MPFNELKPKVAAELATAAYAVNSGDEKALKAFLTRAVFKAGANAKIQLKAEVGGRIFRSARDSFGLAALGRGQYEGDLFLIFRGTTEANNKADFVTDARIGITRSSTSYPVHIGFQHTFSSMVSEISRFTAEHQTQGTVHCIGHSLGGAVAALAAEWAYSNISKQVKLYTFGQPRVGMTLFSQALTQKLGAKNIHRVYHTTDPVPMVPIFPYVHNPLPGMAHELAQNAVRTIR